MVIRSAASRLAVTAAGAMVRLQQQDPDQAAGARGVTVRPPGSVPEPMMGLGESPTGAGRDQRGRARQRAGLAGQDVQVVIQDQVLAALVQRPGMARHHLAMRAGVEHPQGVRAETDLEPAPRYRAGTE